MAGCLALGGGRRGAAWAGDTPPAQIMLRYKPSQDGVVYTIPKPEEEAGLKVESVKGGAGGNGWMLKDANGKTLRLFFNTNPTATHNVPDVWAYYKDGVEVYRESESETKTYAGKPDQFRWLNGGGMKWGVDEAKEGHIKHWKMISPEEVSQEVLQALANKDFARLQALMITDAEMEQLGLPADEVAHIRELEKAAPAKFQKTIADLPKLASGKPTLGPPGNRRAGMRAGRADRRPRRRGQVPARLAPVRGRRRHRLGADRRDDPGRRRPGASSTPRRPAPRRSSSRRAGRSEGASATTTPR